MWDLLSEVSYRAERAAQDTFTRMQARHGRGRATLSMTLLGAWLGGQAMLGPYGLVAFIMMWHIRAQDGLLAMMFLMLSVVLGVAQGAWLGMACGWATALRARRERRKAGVVCWIGSLPYVCLLAWFFYTAGYAYRGGLTALGWLCGLPLVWAGILLLLGARLLSKP